jgi:hypothetical protein
MSGKSFVDDTAAVVVVVAAAVAAVVVVVIVVGDAISDTAYLPTSGCATTTAPATKSDESDKLEAVLF